MKTLQSMFMAAALVAATLASPLAAAHASLKSSVPQAGAVLPAAPKEVTMTFNEKIEQAFSSATLSDGAGKAIATGKARVDETDPTILHLALPALASGDYTVSWAVAGQDGHRRKGSFTFSVK